MLAGTVIVAVMFVSAYMVSNNSAGLSTSTTTVAQVCTSGPWVNESVPATLVGYGSSFSLTVANDSATLNTTSSVLDSMVSNGVAVQVTPNGNTFRVTTFNSSAPYHIYENLSAAIGANAITGERATAYVPLPSRFVVLYRGTSTLITAGSSRYALPSNSLEPIGALINVKVLTTLTSTGQACGNVSVTNP